MAPAPSYVADFGNKRVLRLPAGSSAQQVLPFTGLNTPYGVAVDAAGTLYVADNNRVVKLPAR
jgi:serine/threonine-protein kinase